MAAGAGGMTERCGFSVERMSRICDKPATHLYQGIGGPQPCCDGHAAYLRRYWGIKPAKLLESEKASR
jgi:hypothetical protein